MRGWASCNKKPPMIGDGKWQLRMIESAGKKGMKRISSSPFWWRDNIDRLDVARNVGLVSMADHIVSLHKWEPSVNLCELYFFEDSLTFVIPLALLLLRIFRYSVHFYTVKHTLTSHRHESIRSSTRKIRIAEGVDVCWVLINTDH